MNNGRENDADDGRDEPETSAHRRARRERRKWFGWLSGEMAIGLASLGLMGLGGFYRLSNKTDVIAEKVSHHDDVIHETRDIVTQDHDTTIKTAEDVKHIKETVDRIERKLP